MAPPRRRLTKEEKAGIVAMGNDEAMRWTEQEIGDRFHTSKSNVCKILQKAQICIQKPKTTVDKGGFIDI